MFIYESKTSWVWVKADNNHYFTRCCRKHSYFEVNKNQDGTWYFYPDPNERAFGSAQDAMAQCEEAFNVSYRG